MPRHAFALVFALVASLSALGASRPPSDRDVLTRAAAAAIRFGTELQGVVARERYVQTIRSTRGRPPDDDMAPPTAERRLLSSLLLVHDPETPWQLHRDVVAVDEQPIVDRADRLVRLFADPSADRRAQLAAITDESARYNLGPIVRNINIPTFPLIVVHPSRRDRFRFKDRGIATHEGLAVRVFDVDERDGMATIHGTPGYRVDLRGTLVVDADTGELVEASLAPKMHRLEARLRVWFGRVEGMPIRVPVRLRESYWRVGDDTYTAGEATYDDFRRYVTDVGLPVVK
jgi:hypothetical protein